MSSRYQYANVAHPSIKKGDIVRLVPGDSPSLPGTVHPAQSAAQANAEVVRLHKGVAYCLVKEPRNAQAASAAESGSAQMIPLKLHIGASSRLVVK